MTSSHDTENDSGFEDGRSRERESVADGSSYRKEADGLADLVADGSSYRDSADAERHPHLAEPEDSP